MSIPNGYRLLTSADIGKVFGTDLESMVYFDEDITPTFNLTSIGSLNLTNFCKEERDYLPYAEAEISSGIYLNGSGYIYYELAGMFSPTEADLSGVEITSFNTDYNWNNWLYVKDIEEEDIEDEKVIVTKSKLTTLGDKVRRIKGTSTKYTLDQINEELDNVSSGGGSSGGVDLEETMYFIIGTDSASAVGITYSNDYGKTWNYIDFTADPYGNFTKSLRIECNKGLNMAIDSSGGYSKYGMILIKSPGIISSLTSNMSGTNAFRFTGISQGFILLSRGNLETTFVATFSGGGGAD